MKVLRKQRRDASPNVKAETSDHRVLHRRVPPRVTLSIVSLPAPFPALTRFFSPCRFSRIEALSWSVVLSSLRPRRVLFDTVKVYATGIADWKKAALVPP